MEQKIPHEGSFFDKNVRKLTEFIRKSGVKWGLTFLMIAQPFHIQRQGKSLTEGEGARSVLLFNLQKVAQELIAPTPAEAQNLKDLKKLGELAGAYLLKQEIEKQIHKNWEKKLRNLFQNSQVESLKIEVNDLSRIANFFKERREKEYFSIDPQNIQISFLKRDSYNYNLDLNLLKDMISEAIGTALSTSYNINRGSSFQELKGIAEERRAARNEEEIKQETIPKSGTLIYPLYDVTKVSVVFSEIKSKDDWTSFLGFLGNLIGGNLGVVLDTSSLERTIIVCSMVIEITNKETGEKISILTFAPPAPIQSINQSFTGVFSRVIAMRGGDSMEENQLNVVLSSLAAANNTLLVLLASRNEEFIKLQQELRNLEIEKDKKEFEKKLNEIKKLIQTLQPPSHPVVGVAGTKTEEDKK